MGYEDLLDEAFESVKPCEECGRFEILKVSGHIEGSKAIVTNFAQVAACLRRDPEHLAKFLFKELATSGDIKGDRLIFPRKVSSKVLNEKIEKYVHQFVLCPVCKKPDTELVSEKGKSYIRCMACGKKWEVHKV
jgi:translation initiation factor 2 subunit 2